MNIFVSRSGGGLHRSLIAFLIAVLFLAWSVPTNVRAAAGDLDLSFGNGGKVVTPGGPSSFDIISDIVIQPDGKIIAVGVAIGGGFDLVRYNTDGSLDVTFGSGGKVQTDFFAEATSVVLQPDGKIVVGGIVGSTPPQPDFGLARFNTDGSPDTNFGAGGRVVTDFFGNADQLFELALQPDGKIVAVGVAYTFGLVFGDFAVARYNADGSPDMNFGAGGKLTTNITSFVDEAHGVAIQPDGKIVVAGTATSDFALVRYDAAGNPDPTFGVGGVVTTDFSGNNEQANALALQSDGKIIVVGRFFNIQTSKSDFALARYNADGSPDQGFGAGGKVVTDFSGGDDIAYDVAIQPGGRIVVVGAAGPDFGLARYDASGNLDASFGMGGKVTTDFSGGTDFARAVAIQQDAKIVAAGGAAVLDFADFALARYSGQLPGHLFNLCLEDESTANLLLINTATGEYQFTNCGGISVGGRGQITKKGSIITLQHNAADRTVIAKIDTSVRKGTATIDLVSSGRVFTITDRNTANNSCACR